MRYIDRELRLTPREVRLRYLPYCYTLADDGTVILSNRDYVPIWIYEKAGEGGVEWIRAARPTAFCSPRSERSGHFYNDAAVSRASDAAPNPDRSRERYESAVLDRLVSHVTAAMMRRLGVRLPLGWNLEDRNNKAEAWDRDEGIPLQSSNNFSTIRAKVAPEGLEPVGASSDEILLGSKWDAGPYSTDSSRRWWQGHRSLAIGSIPFWEWVAKLKPTGKRLAYDYFLQDTKDLLARHGPWACCAGIENSSGELRAIWRELRGKYVARGGNFDAWDGHPGQDFRNKLTGVMRVCPECAAAPDLELSDEVRGAQVPWRDHVIKCVTCKKWICVDHAFACQPMMTYLDSNANTGRRRYCGGAFCEKCIARHECEYTNLTVKPAVGRQVASAGTGHFYLVQMIPDIDPKRIKTGYTARHPLARAIEYSRTGNPTCELLAAWECESRRGEREARLALLDGISGVRHVKGEVYDVDDIPALIDRAVKYFGCDPFQLLAF